MYRRKGSEFYNQIKVYKSPALYVINKPNDWMCGAGRREDTRGKPGVPITWISQHCTVDGALSQISRHVIFTTTLWSTSSLISQVRTKHRLSRLPRVTQSRSRMQPQPQIVAPSSSVFCCASLPLRTRRPKARLTALPGACLPGPLLLHVSAWSPFHQPNGWSPAPTATEASNSQVPPSQPPASGHSGSLALLQPLLLLQPPLHHKSRKSHSDHLKWEKYWNFWNSALDSLISLSPSSPS